MFTVFCTKNLHLYLASGSHKQVHYVYNMREGWYEGTVEALKATARYILNVKLQLNSHEGICFLFLSSLLRICIR